MLKGTLQRRNRLSTLGNSIVQFANTQALSGGMSGIVRFDKRIKGTIITHKFVVLRGSNYIASNCGCERQSR